jgi:nitrogen fixation protein FixH
MTPATAPRRATGWRDWAWLPLAVAVILIGVLILAGLLSKSWTGVVAFGALILTNGGRVLRYSKTLRAKLLSR